MTIFDGFIAVLPHALVCRETEDVKLPKALVLLLIQDIIGFLRIAHCHGCVVG